MSNYIGNSNTDSIQLSAAALNSADGFAQELASFCHQNSGARASAFCKLSDTGAVKWLETVGDHQSSLANLAANDSFRSLISDSISNQVELNFYGHHAASAGAVFAGQVSQTDQDSSDSDPSVVPELPVELATDETAHYLVRDMIWIRPLSDSHAIVSVVALPESDEKKSHHENLSSKPQQQYLSTIRVAQALRRTWSQSEANRRLSEQQHTQLNLASTISNSLPLQEMGFELANQLQEYLECDRVVVLDVNGKSAKAIAFSGQPKFNPRSNSVRATQNMVQKVAATGDPFWFTGDFESLPDSVRSLVQFYTDETLVNSFVAFPVVETTSPVYPSEDETMQEAISPGSCSARKTVGVILIEQIEDVINQPSIENRWEPVRELVENQFTNSRRYDSLFLVGLWDKLGRFAAFYRGQTAKKAYLITAAILLFLLGSLLIPSDFKIRCEGYLVIDGTREFYSMGSGPITDLRVQDGQKVKAGETLLVQEDSEMQKRMIQLAGQVSQLQVEIDALNDARIRGMYTSTAEKEKTQRDELIQQISVKEIELDSHTRELASLQMEFDRLTIVAPVDGTIAQWKIQRKIFNRHLDKGTHLFSLIPDDSESMLELRVPDQRAGYVQKAWQQSLQDEKDLELVFRLSSAPGVEQVASVNFVSPSLEKDADIGYSLLVRATSTKEISPELVRAKTVVLGKVICGRRSIAYCKSYEALDWIKSKMFEFVH